MKINNKNNVGLFLIILGTIVFFFFGLPMLEKNQSKENFNYLSILPTNNNSISKIDTNKCSTSCCGINQWPVPNDMADPNMSPDELKNYIPSNFGCASGDYNGCVCLTHDDSNYLTNHGQNKI
jgi:hypothetical protein